MANNKSNAWENALLLHLFNNDDVANIGDAGGIRGSVADGNLYISLHTADPGEAGTQATSEVSTSAYVNYARVAVPRTTGGWTVTNNSVANAADVDFATAGNGGTNPVITHYGIGVASSGASMLLYSGPLQNNRTVADGSTPSFAAGQITVTEE